MSRYDIIHRPGKGFVNSFMDDFDLESNDSDTNCDIFKLKSVLQKAWVLLVNINTCICQESADFVLRNKPIFDKQKLILIQIDTFIEKDLQCGTFIMIKERQPFHCERPLANDTHFSLWNDTASTINNTIADVNSTILAHAQIQQIKAGAKRGAVTSSHADFFKTFRRLCLVAAVIFSIVGFLFTMYTVGWEMGQLRNVDAIQERATPTFNITNVN